MQEPEFMGKATGASLEDLGTTTHLDKHILPEKFGPQPPGKYLINTMHVTHHMVS